MEIKVFDGFEDIEELIIVFEYYELFKHFKAIQNVWIT